MAEVLVLIFVVGIFVAFRPKSPESSLTPAERATVAEMHVRRVKIQRARTCTCCGQSYRGLPMAPEVTPPTCELCAYKNGCKSCKRKLCREDCPFPRCSECGLYAHRGVEWVEHPETPHFGKTHRCENHRPGAD